MQEETISVEAVPYFCSLNFVNSRLCGKVLVLVLSIIVCTGDECRACNESQQHGVRRVYRYSFLPVSKPYKLQPE